MNNLIILEGLEKITIHEGNNQRIINIPKDKIYSLEQKRQFVRNIFGDDIAEKLLMNTYNPLPITKTKFWLGVNALVTNKDFFNTNEDSDSESNMHKVKDDLGEAQERANIIIRDINFKLSHKSKRDSVELKTKIINNKTKEKDKPKESDKIKPIDKPNNKYNNSAMGSILTLKSLCEQLQIEPGKARRILRKYEGQIKVNGKWEWDIKKDSSIIERVKQLLK